MRRLLFLTSILILSSLAISVAQDYSIGDWKVHLPYNACKQLAYVEDDNVVYGISDYGLFRYYINSDELEEISKINGLSNSDFSRIEFDDVTDQLVIGYRNGTIDLLSHENNSVYTINDIERTSITGSKQINHIFIDNGIAYLSCEFGLVLLDLSQKLIKDSYLNVGENGDVVAFKSVTMSLDNLLIAATDEGLKTADLSANLVLQDKNNWNHIGLPSATDIAANFVGEIDDIIYYPVDEDRVYKYENGVWDTAFYAIDYAIQQLRKVNDIIYIVYDDGVFELKDDDEYQELSFSKDYNPRDYFPLSSSTYLMASSYAGIVYYRNSSPLAVYPSGPGSISAFQIKYVNGDVQILRGARNKWSGIYFPGSISVYSGSWQTRGITGSHTITDVLYDPSRKQYFYMSMRRGLTVMNQNFEFVKRYNDTTPGSPFYNALDLAQYDKYLDYVKVTEARRDASNNIWFINTETRGNEVLHKLKPDDTWESYRPSGDDANYPVELEIDAAGNKWMHLEGPNGLDKILVYNEVSGRQFDITTKVNEGELPNSNVNDITIDLDDNIWIATDAGVAVFYNASSIFSGNIVPVASKPIVEGRPLLEDESVNTIRVDGANRKWFGTKNGAFLFSDNGTENIITLNEDNSPLLSNNVLSIGVHGGTGEVFFGTDRGVISYWNDATIGTAVHETVGNNELMIFPNPVPPNFDGMVGITGLVQDAQVKITDVSGKIVYENFAEGGMITWDANDSDGNRVATGVYLVFSASADGVETFVGKLVVVK